MIVEKISKLDESKKKTAAVLSVLTTATICYFAITRDSVMRLQGVNEDYTGIQAVYRNTEYQQAEISNLEKQLLEQEKQLQEAQQQCFNSTQAMQFFENINTLALASNLKPISSIISGPKALVSGKDKRRFLKAHSVKVAVSGNYYDINDFMKELVDRPQKISITNLHIALDAGEDSSPKASFKITLVVDTSEDSKQ